MTPSQQERYSRQVRFEGIGERGQRKLLQSHIAIVGCGALGSFQAEALARAGLGTLTIIDRDFVEWSNLQRQWLYDEQDAISGTPKAIAAARRLSAINSECTVHPLNADLHAGNIDDLLSGAHLILDATDNFETRYLLNEYAVRENKPWVYGAAVGSYGIVMPVLPGATACLNCLYPTPPGGVQETCETAGVLGSVTATVAALQVAVALRLLITGGGQLKRTVIDVWTGDIRTRPTLTPQPGCTVCERSEYPYLSEERRTPVSLCGRNAVQIHERQRPLDLARLSQMLEKLGEVRWNEFALRFFSKPYELTVFPDGRAIVKGTTDIGLARSLYAKYIGA
ncbi:MAG TPA: ThiF family adenylyltransferase [Bryobacteraceae bacterium]|nr:ThiF family adenylyltransferase [Bryobacteraceae bacterium]